MHYAFVNIFQSIFICSNERIIFRLNCKIILHLNYFIISKNYYTFAVTLHNFIIIFFFIINNGKPFFIDILVKNRIELNEKVIL